MGKREEKRMKYAIISNEKVSSTLKWNLTIQTLIVEFNCSHDYNIPQMVLILKGVLKCLIISIYLLTID